MTNLSSSKSADAATERKSIPCCTLFHCSGVSTHSSNGDPHSTEITLSEQTIGDDNNNCKSSHPARNAFVGLPTESTSNGLSFLLSRKGDRDSFLTVHSNKRLRCCDNADSGKRTLVEESKMSYPAERGGICDEGCDEKNNSLPKKMETKQHSKKVVPSSSESLHEMDLSSTLLKVSEDCLSTASSRRSQQSLAKSHSDLCFPLSPVAKLTNMSSFSDYLVGGMRKRNSSLKIEIDMTKEETEFTSGVEPGSQPVDLTALENEETSMEKWVDEYSCLASGKLMNDVPLLATKDALCGGELFFPHTCGAAKSNPSLEKEVSQNGELGEIFAATQEAEILEGAERASGLFLSLKKKENDCQLLIKKNCFAAVGETPKKSFVSHCSFIEKPSSHSARDQGENAMSTYVQETRAFFSRLDMRPLIVVKPTQEKVYTRLPSSSRSLSAASTKTMKILTNKVTTVSSPTYFERVLKKMKKKIGDGAY